MKRKVLSPLISSSGFGLMEVVVGILVFFVTMLTMLAGINTGLITAKMAAIRSAALRWAQAGIEQLRTWDYDEITEERLERSGLKTKEVSLTPKGIGPLGIKATRVISIKENTEFAEKLVTAKVSWETARGNSKVTFSTIFRKFK
jgi:hypothetical protein